jgi:putative restriction endonuclease
MARLPKNALLREFEDAVRVSGWSLLYRSKSGVHPAYYTVWRDEERYRVKVYIWNITPGGRASLPNEYRIQVTGVEKFETESNTRTLALGWWDEVGVFAGWDVRQHAGMLGSSPSLQINEVALQKALLSGFAPSIKTSGETAIALRPDFMGTYVQHLETLHDSGKIPKEFKVLSDISDAPEKVDEDEIESEVASPRKKALISTWKNLRANDFSLRVLTAYSNRCAMCGVQLRLIDGAHILPVEEPGSTDDTNNGVALCALHHRAYDRSLVTFDQRFKVHVNQPMVKTLKSADRAAGLSKFTTALRSIILTPPDKKDRPKSKFVEKANTLRGWKV